MAKGILNQDKWLIWRMFGDEYAVERIVDDSREYHEISAHCLACAKVEALIKWGGKVDMRGWHNQGICGIFLYATATDIENDPNTINAEIE